MSFFTVRFPIWESSFPYMGTVVSLYGNYRYPIWKMHLPTFENAGKHEGVILNILYPMC